MFSGKVIVPVPYAFTWERRVHFSGLFVKLKIGEDRAIATVSNKAGFERKMISLFIGK
jgi:hypothetical protein